MDTVEPTWRVKTHGYKVTSVPVGRADGPHKLRVSYRPSGKWGKAVPISSNHPRYGKTWPTRGAAEQPENKEAFLRWVETGLGQGAGGSHSTTDASSIEGLLGAAATKAVAEVIRRRVTPKLRGGRGGGGRGGGALVKPGGNLALSIRRPLFSRTNHKVREWKKKRRQVALTQAGEKAAANSEWLSRQIKHLAAVIACRQPEVLLPEDGDFSESQLDRAAQQACVLHRFYVSLLEQNVASLDRASDHGPVTDAHLSEVAAAEVAAAEPAQQRATVYQLAAQARHPAPNRPRPPTVLRYPCTPWAPPL